MLRHGRKAVIVVAVMALLAGCRASGEIDVDENEGDGGAGVEVDVGDPEGS